MLEIKFEKTDKEDNVHSRLTLFRQVFQGMSDLEKEIVMRFESTGIMIQTIDKMQVCFVSVFLSADMFSFYRNDNFELKICVSLTELNGILKKLEVSNEKDVVMISAENSPTELNICNNTKYSTIVYLVSLAKSSEGIFETPNDTDSKSSVTLTIDIFKKLISNLSNFGDLVTFTVEKGTLLINQHGDMSAVDITLEDNDDSIQVSCSQPVSVMFSKKYLELLNKMISGCDKVTVEFGDESSPLKFSVDLNKMGHVFMVVAPQQKE
ncbi:PCNA [Hepatospora eriocheir]|uniref:DNA sliding clamp PCNA n=1 Tax=Hepatospora eriocheir TaxID=1081669 RepID=A0A1X0QHV7_9MICR|nr:PCNA [Hepatospora eriocheir]